MQRIQTAQARSRGYALLSRFTAHGLCTDMLPTLRQVPLLAETLPQTYDADAAAAAHYAVFGRTVFAYESVFLSDAALRGGHAVARVATTFAECGFAATDAQEADGLPSELACLAHLCAAEAEALEDGQASAADRAHALQAQVLAKHLLCWLPPVCEVMQRLPDSLYANVGALLWDFVADHATALTTPLAFSPPASAPQSAPNPLAQSTRLGEIADWLVAPVGAGFLLTREDLHTMAASLDVPTGFADRRTLLMDLLRAGWGERCACCAPQRAGCARCASGHGLRRDGGQCTCDRSVDKRVGQADPRCAWASRRNAQRVGAALQHNCRTATRRHGGHRGTLRTARLLLPFSAFLCDLCASVLLFRRWFAASLQVLPPIAYGRPKAGRPYWLQNGQGNRCYRNVTTAPGIGIRRSRC